MNYYPRQDLSHDKYINICLKYLEYFPSVENLTETESQRVESNVCCTNNTDKTSMQLRRQVKIKVKMKNKKKVVLTTKLLLTFSKMRFSFNAIASPFLFFTRFFSSFLQAYILPVARTWQAQT